MLREKVGLSVEEVVAAIVKLGHTVSTKTLYNWESGTREPPFDVLPAIATTYKMKSVRFLMPEK